MLLICCGRPPSLIYLITPIFSNWPHRTLLDTPAPHHISLVYLVFGKLYLVFGIFGRVYWLFCIFGIADGVDGVCVWDFSNWQHTRLLDIADHHIETPSPCPFTNFYFDPNLPRWAHSKVIKYVFILLGHQLPSSPFPKRMNGCHLKSG